MRQDIADRLHGVARSLGVEATETLLDMTRSRLDFHRTHVDRTALASVHLTSDGRAYPETMRVAVTRPGESLVDGVPTDGTTSDPSRTVEVRAHGPKDPGRLDAMVRDEVRRGLGMPVGLARERDLERSVRDALRDGAEGVAEVLARIAAEHGFARELAAALDARAEHAPSP